MEAFFIYCWFIFVKINAVPEADDDDSLFHGRPLGLELKSFPL